MSIDDAEQQSLHAKEIAFLRAVTDPQELLRFCQDARKGLASSDPFRQYNAWHSPVILREVWDAMFRIGGAVPHAPALLKIEDSAAAFAGLLLGEPDRYACPIDAINAFSAATAWCNAFAENLPNGSPPAAIVGPGNGKAGGEQSEGGDIGRRLDDGPGPADEELNDRQRDILEAMLKNDISGANRREKLNNIVKRINQIVKSINRIQNAATCGRDFAGLVKLGYLASREGPLGGYWLTSKGKIEALRLHTPG